MSKHSNRALKQHYRDLNRMLEGIIADQAMQNACSAVTSKLFSNLEKSISESESRLFPNVPRGTSIPANDPTLNVPRGTLDGKHDSDRDVPRGTLRKSTPLPPRKGLPMSTPVPPANKAKRLGRGLSSLMSVSELPVQAEVTAAQGVAVSAPQQGGSTEPIIQNEPKPAPPVVNHGPLEIAVEQIAPNPHQPRREMNESSLNELAASLKSSGLIQPIIVRKVQDGYQLIAGERRLRASKLAGMKAIPAIVRDVDSFTQAQMALIENIQREDLNPVDRALAYRALMNQLGLTQQELATRMGEDRTSITHYIRLLDLAEPVRELVRSSKLSMGHAKLLGGVPDILEQQRLANLCITQDLSVRNLERLLSAGGNAPATPAVKAEKGTSAHLLDLEKTIARQLGMRVQVRAASKSKGRLVIHYGSLDQFDDLLKKLNVRIDD